jgi:hypothetical protein
LISGDCSKVRLHAGVYIFENTAPPPHGAERNTVDAFWEKIWRREGGEEKNKETVKIRERR